MNPLAPSDSASTSERAEQPKNIGQASTVQSPKDMSRALDTYTAAVGPAPTTAQQVALFVKDSMTAITHLSKQDLKSMSVAGLSGTGLGSFAAILFPEPHTIAVMSAVAIGFGAFCAAVQFVNIVRKAQTERETVDPEILKELKSMVEQVKSLVPGWTRRDIKIASAYLTSNEELFSRHAQYFDCFFEMRETLYEQCRRNLMGLRQRA